MNKHLQVLSDAGLVSRRRAGRETRYTLRPAPLDEVKAWLAFFDPYWDGRLARLKQWVEAVPGGDGGAAELRGSGGGPVAGQAKPHRPIGYWLKKVDGLLTARINEAQEANGLSRIEWQVLNVLHEAPDTSRTGIAQALEPFADGVALEPAVAGLLGRGLVEEEPGSGKLRLTGQGKALHAAALETQKKVRERAMRGIDEADYMATLRVLQRMASNLSGGEASGGEI